jgi:hypothetical protein
MTRFRRSDGIYFKKCFVPENKDHGKITFRTTLFHQGSSFPSYSKSRPECSEVSDLTNFKTPETPSFTSRGAMEVPKSAEQPFSMNHMKRGYTVL